MLFKDILPQDLYTEFEIIKLLIRKGNLNLIHKQKLHINIIHQISSSLYTRYMRKEENLIYEFILYTRNFLQQNEKQILHNGEYQSRYTMKNIYYISYFIQ